MDLSLPIGLSLNYTSLSQRIRVMTEEWVSQSIFCPKCGQSLSHFQNNQPVVDFYCPGCAEEFELKSKNGVIGRKVVDGAYSSMVERLKASHNPNFFFLTYTNKLAVHDFLVIPKYFFIPSIIEKRSPLSDGARQDGWVGCTILMESIPDLGKIFFVRSGSILHKEDVLAKWKQTEFVRDTHNLEAKSWLLDVLRCVERIKKKEFTLDEVCQFEADLKKKYPQNSNIQTKIRQQLQILRDEGAIDFLGGGRYRLRARTE